MENKFTHQYCDDEVTSQMSSGDPTGNRNVASDLSFPSSSASSPSLGTTMDIKTAAFHRSMEDIHHPKNFRCGKPTATVTTTPFKKSPVFTASAPYSPSPSHQTQSASNCTALMKMPCSLVPGDTENGGLYKYIEAEKRATLLRKVAMSFVYGALKRSSERLIQYEEQHQLKSMECAARLILNNLLLNSWRKDRIQLGKFVQDNAQLTIHVENLGLQLRVLRHLQSQEKDQANEKVCEIRNLKAQVHSAQKSLKIIECDLASAQEELRYAREDNEKFVEQKAFTQKELSELLEQKDALAATVDLERKRVLRAEEECQMIKGEYADLRKQVKDLSNQSFQWRERARNLESKGIQIGEDLELRETSLRVLESNFQLLLADLEQFKMKKEALQEAYEVAHSMLKAEVNKSETLKAKFENASSAVITQQEKLMTLEESILKLRAESQKTEKEFYWHKLQNVRNRRAWGSAFSVVFSPTKLVQYLLFGSVSDNRPQF